MKSSSRNAVGVSTHTESVLSRHSSSFDIRHSGTPSLITPRTELFPGILDWIGEWDSYGEIGAILSPRVDVFSKSCYTSRFQDQSARCGPDATAATSVVNGYGIL